MVVVNSTVVQASNSLKVYSTNTENLPLLVDSTMVQVSYFQKFVLVAQKDLQYGNRVERETGEEKEVGFVT